MKRYALSAVGRDRPGIVAAVAKALYDHACNIEDSTMTRLEDEFAIILIMSAPDDINEKPLLSDLKRIEKSFKLTIHLKTIEKRLKLEAPQSNYIVTLHGADKRGLVHRTAEFLNKEGANITDLDTKIAGSGKEKVYVMVMEVFAPKDTDIKNLEDGLNAIGSELGVSIRIKPLEAYEPL